MSMALPIVCKDQPNCIPESNFYLCSIRECAMNFEKHSIE